MSPKDASTHKRKASSPEAPVTAVTSEQHDSKKARKDTTNTEGQHTDDCEDENCEGCAEGEIVLQFETAPSAAELFQMAREEMTSSNSTESGSSSGTKGLSRMAKALFDKAIEEFELLEKKDAHIELNDGTEVAKKVVETKMQHAACVVAMGNHIPSVEMLQEGTRMFEELAKRTGHENGNVLVGLGIAEISQAREHRRLAMKALLPEDEDEDEEPTEEQRSTACLVGKPEAKLVHSALEDFKKGLKLLKDETKSESGFAQESIRAAQELEEYGISLDLKMNSGLASTIFDQAVQHLEDAQKSKAQLVDSNADVLSIYGSCLYSKAKLADHQSGGDENPAKHFVEKAIELLVKAETMQGEEGDAKTLETLGQVYLMSIELLDDEDLIMERVDAAKEKLSRALELDPYNFALEEQVEALRGEDDDEEGGEDFEDEDVDEYDEEEDGDEAVEEAEDQE